MWSQNRDDCSPKWLLLQVATITDGKANIPLSRSLAQSQIDPAETSIKDELLKIAAAIQTLGIQLLVIDTENKFISSGFGKELAHRAKGKYYYLPKATDRVISAMTKNAIASYKYWINS